MLRVCLLTASVLFAGCSAALCDQTDRAANKPGPAMRQAEKPAYKGVRPAPSSKPVELRPGPHLFIDEYLIARTENLKKTVHSPRRVGDGPVLGYKQHTTQPYMTVLHDPAQRLFRLWYNYGFPPHAYIGYAESNDGVNFRLPELNIHGADNRVLCISPPAPAGAVGFSCSLVDDGPGCREPDRRYKLMWWQGDMAGSSAKMGMHVGFSADGIHWTPHEGNPVLPYYGPAHPRFAWGVSDIVDAFYDPIRRRYVAMFKMSAAPSDGYRPGPRAKAHIRRLVGSAVSRDFVNWSEPWRVITPPPDSGLLEFYGVGDVIARGPLLIGFVRMLHDDLPVEKGSPPAGIGYTNLTTSRDGEHWQLHDEIFFDRNPKPGAWDRAMTWVSSVVPVGDQFYIYYGGYKQGHKIEPRKERQLGLAKMPADRFVSRDAGKTPGRLLTVPLRLQSAKARLVLNADAAKGRIRVQVRDASGQVVPGYGFDDCLPIETDGPRLPVQRSGGRGNLDLGPLANRTFRLEFEIANAALFGFDLAEEN